TRRTGERREVSAMPRHPRPLSQSPKHLRQDHPSAPSVPSHHRWMLDALGVMIAALLLLGGLHLYAHVPFTTLAAVPAVTPGSARSPEPFQLVESAPAPGSWLRDAPREVLLEFSHDVDATAARVHLKHHLDDRPIEGTLTRT